MKACNDVKLNYAIQKLLGLLAKKQDALTFDSKLTKDSTGIVTSGVVYDAVEKNHTDLTSTLHEELAKKQDTLTFDSELTQDGTGIVTSGIIHEALTKKEDKSPVGTIITTVRTDLGDEWALCDGSLIDEETGGDVYPMLSSKPEKHTFEVHTNKTYSMPANKKIFGRNAFEISKRMVNFKFGDADRTKHHYGVGYFDMDTNEKVFVPMHATQLLDGSIDWGYLFGIDWNGEEWVMCLGNPNYGTFNFYTSQDLKSWTQVASVTDDDNIKKNSSQYAGFFYDGAVYRITGTRIDYYDVTYTIVSKDFTNVQTSRGDGNVDIRCQLCGDYLFVFKHYYYGTDGDPDEGGGVRIYKPGEVNGGSSYQVNSSQTVWKYDDDHYIFFPSRYYYLSDRVYVYTKSTSSWAVLTIGPHASNNLSACSQPYYDPENDRLVFLSGPCNSTPTHYVYLPYSANPIVADNYTYEEIPSTDTNLLKLENGIYPNDLKGWYSVDGNELHICNSKFRALPNIINDRAYSYIKTRE